MHNLRFYLNSMGKMRTAIEYDYFDKMLAEFKDYTAA
jgi:queuine/archaeosine tRNA-ribosyltransferase